MGFTVKCVYFTVRLSLLLLEGKRREWARKPAPFWPRVQWRHHPAGPRHQTPDPRPHPLALPLLSTRFGDRANKSLRFVSISLPSTGAVLLVFRLLPDNANKSNRNRQLLLISLALQKYIFIHFVLGKQKYSYTMHFPFCMCLCKMHKLFIAKKQNVISVCPFVSLACGHCGNLSVAIFRLNWVWHESASPLPQLPKKILLPPTPSQPPFSLFRNPSLPAAWLEIFRHFVQSIGGPQSYRATARTLGAPTDQLGVFVSHGVPDQDSLL